MFERLARWLLLYLALALTLLGRPSEACDTRQADDEARRAETSETALISEGRRMPSLKRAGSEVRSSKSQAGQLLAGASDRDGTGHLDVTRHATGDGLDVTHDRRTVDCGGGVRHGEHRGVAKIGRAHV